MSPKTCDFLATICPYPLSGVRPGDLADILDAWLADEFARDDHRHIHDLSEEWDR